MLDDRWPETQSGTVVRSYFHLRGANREMEAAQKEGWSIEEVKLNGNVVTVNDRRGIFRRSPLVRDRNGTLGLRNATGWQQHNIGKGLSVEVTYAR